MKDETLKRTKLGWIPEGWEVINVEDSQINVIDGDRGKNYPKRDEFLEEGFCLFLNASNVTKAGFKFDSCQFVSKEKDHSLRKGKLKRNDLVLTTRGTVGNIAFFDSSVPFEIMRINSGMVILRNENSHISNRFAYIIFGSDLLQNQIKRIAFGSAQPQLTVGTIKKLAIPLPSLPEQRKIAEILGTWDKAIALTEQLIAAKQQRKRALMQRLLTGRVRFSEFEGEEWREVRLGDLGETYSGLTGKSKQDFGQGKPYIPYLNIYNNWVIDPEQMDYVSIEDGKRQNRVKYGDIFFTTSSETPQEVGMSSVILNHLEEAYLNSFCYGFRLKDFANLLPEYAVYLLRGEDFRHAMHYLAQGATRYNLTKRYLLEASLGLPPLAEQCKIAKVLSACDTEINLLRQKLAALQRQKKGLMQWLLTGRVRVKV